MERLALLLASLCYFFGFGQTFFALGAGRFQPGRFTFAAMAVGAAAQGWYLALEGARLHACPISTLPEILIFLGWSIVLIYLVIGPSYRLSLMGAFTAPLVLLLQIIAILLPAEVSGPARIPNPWVEAHAALSLVAYGAFGLACIAGFMFLVQEAQLKSRHPARIFHYLPPISILSQAILRLLWTGFVLLSLGFATGWHAHLPVAGVKSWFSLLIWAQYALLLLGARTGLVTGRRKAIGAVLAFLVILLLLPVIQHLSAR